MLEVMALSSNTCQSPFTYVPCHLPDCIFSWICCELFYRWLSWAVSCTLASSSDSKIKKSLWATSQENLGDQCCSVFLDKILSPNFDLKKSRHGRVTWLVAPSCWYQYCFLVATALTAGQSTFLRTFKYTSLLTEPSNHTTWRHFPSTMPVHAIHSSSVVLRHSASTFGFIGVQYRSFWRLGVCCAFSIWSQVLMQVYRK